MRREAGFFLVMFLFAFVGGTAVVVHGRLAFTQRVTLAPLPQPQPTITAFAPWPSAASHNDARSTLTATVEGQKNEALPHESAEQLNEIELAKAIVKENASWLFQHDSSGRLFLDAEGKLKLTPVGERYAYFIKLSEQDGITGALNQHAWAITRVSGEVNQSQQPGETPSMKIRNRLDMIEGCFILAGDKQYLGKLTWNEFNSESILNEFGRYGGKFSSTSIFNEFGRYGGEIAIYSPFNAVAVNPPKIYTQNGDFVAYLTVNTVKFPRIDPHALIAFLKSR